MSGETLHVHFLGTAGALPTPHRNPSCLMIRRGSDTLLFDCGEGAQQQMMRARTGFTVNAVFISHWHADHFLGIFGLVQTLSFNGRTAPLTVYGPEWVHECVQTIRHIGKFNLSFPIESVELADGSWVRFDGYTVTAFSAHHGLPALGYMLEEDKRPGRFDRERAIELGVPAGPLFGRLQRGEPVMVEKGGEPRVIRPPDVLGPSRPGRKVVYTGDTRPIPQRLATIAHEADLLIHDATYDDTEETKAAEFYHTTAGQAGETAALACVQVLALVHISSRYTDAQAHIACAEREFSGRVVAPNDLDMIDVPFRG